MAEYQGWQNWQTWNLALYLNNEHADYLAMRTLARSGIPVTADVAQAFVRSRASFSRGTPDMRGQDTAPGNAQLRAVGVNPIEWHMAQVDWPSIAELIRESGED